MHRIGWRRNPNRKRIMKKGDLTREQAIELAGVEAVEAAENESCQPTGRVGYNGECQSDDLCEWASSKNGVTVYYYTTNEDDAIMSVGSCIDWDIEGYEVI